MAFIPHLLEVLIQFSLSEILPENPLHYLLTVSDPKLLILLMCFNFFQRQLYVASHILNLFSLSSSSLDCKLLERRDILCIAIVHYMHLAHNTCLINITPMGERIVTHISNNKHK